ncbi:hypothetical protein ACFLZX_05805 [Nanoarchaeota archaeon]
MKVDIKITASGYTIRYKNEIYPVRFPKEIWKKFPLDLKRVFVDNLSFLQTSELPFMLMKDKCDYGINEPLVRSLLFRGIIQYLPYSTDMDNKSTTDEIKRFLKLKYNFSGPVRLPKNSFETEDRGVISLTFGKDSMLSYALSEEIGLNPIGVTIDEGASPNEIKHRRNLRNRFKKEFNATVYNLRDLTLALSDYQLLKIKKTHFGYANALTGFALIMLPFNYVHKAKYIVVGNEQSCNDYYMNKEGYKSFPVSDQSANSTKQNDVITKTLSKGAVSTLSLIEPIHEIAVMKILHNRYPQYGRYQMSCFPDDHKSGAMNRWCHKCSKCARMAIFAHGLGIDLNKLGFKESMLSSTKKRIFSIFGDTKGNVAFDITGVGRDEQLFSFYLAYKNGAKGYLINKFKEGFLDEAKEREDELYKTYFSIHSSTTIPNNLKDRVLSIYKEEL